MAHNRSGEPIMTTPTIHLMDYCKTCNQRFLGVDDRIYCSKHCKDVGEATFGVTRLYCLFCGKEYTVKDKHNRFCCGTHAEKEKKNKPRTYRRCTICNKPYKPRNYRQLFCSKKCANTVHNPRKTPEIKYCTICTKPFRPYRTHQLCCSKACSIQHKKNDDQSRYLKKKENTNQ